MIDNRGRKEAQFHTQYIDSSKNHWLSKIAWLLDNLDHAFSKEEENI